MFSLPHHHSVLIAFYALLSHVKENNTSLSRFLPLHLYLTVDSVVHPGGPLAARGQHRVHLQVRESGSRLSNLHVLLLHRRHRLRPVQVHRSVPAAADDCQPGDFLRSFFRDILRYWIGIMYNICVSKGGVGPFIYASDERCK